MTPYIIRQHSLKCYNIGGGGQKKFAFLGSFFKKKYGRFDQRLNYSRVGYVRTKSALNIWLSTYFIHIMRMYLFWQFLLIIFKSGAHIFGGK